MLTLKKRKTEQMSETKRRYMLSGNFEHAPDNFKEGQVNNLEQADPTMRDFVVVFKGRDIEKYPKNKSISTFYG